MIPLLGYVEKALPKNLRPVFALVVVMLAVAGSLIYFAFVRPALADQVRVDAAQTEQLGAHGARLKALEDQRAAWRKESSAKLDCIMLKLDKKPCPR